MNTALSFEPHLRHLIATLLWKERAIAVSTDTPFRLTSGNFSPIYINCRLLISSPTFMSCFASLGQLLLQGREVKVDKVAGGETAGIPFAAYFAQQSGLPLVYVRKAEKAHGISKLVEGKLVQGDRVLLIEDLITDGGSKMHFIEALRREGAVATNVLVLFDRGQGGAQVLREHGVALHALADLQTALRVGCECRLMSIADFDAVNVYLQSPEEWHRTRGLAFAV